MLARAAAPGDGGSGVGVSAFAFAGTNAHAVVLPAVDGGGSRATTPAALPWRRARAWFAPPPHALLWRVAATERATVFSLPSLATTPATAYLHQHVVAGVPLLPAAAMLEAAAAAVRCAGGGGDARPSRCVVSGASVAAPCWLARDAPSPAVSVTVADDGGVTVASSAGRHLAARAVWVGTVAQRAPRRWAAFAPRLPPPPPPRRAVGTLTPATTGQPGAHWHHPACLDAATHAAAATARGDDAATPRVPVSVAAAWLAAPARATGWATAAVSPTGREVRADVGVPGGGVLVGFTARAARALKAPRPVVAAGLAPHLLYDTVWQVEEPREHVAAAPPSTEFAWLTATPAARRAARRRRTGGRRGRAPRRPRLDALPDGPPARHGRGPLWCCPRSSRRVCCRGVGRAAVCDAGGTHRALGSGGGGAGRASPAAATHGGRCLRRGSGSGGDVGAAPVARACARGHGATSAAHP